MKESVFRAYDIRGTIGKNFLLDSVYNLGLAIAYFFKTQYPHIKSIIIGNDPRLHSEYIKKELIRSFLESGFSVFDNGLSSSPLIYFALHTKSIDAGIMITASHNGKDDNGIKINIGTHAITSDEIQQIKRNFFEKKSINSAIPGSLSSISIHDEYISYLVNNFAHLIGNKISCVIDCGNGSSGLLLKEIVRRMRWENVCILHANPDGNFPHHAPDPTDIENMSDVASCLQRGAYEFGIGIDGDADRMSVMNKSGTLLSGDLVLALFAQDLQRHEEKPIIICNVLASDVIMEHLKKKGITSYTVPVGNPIMRAMMTTYKAHIGGETSGHFFFQDRYFGFDDGVYAMMRFFELMAYELRPIEDCTKEFPKTWISPEFRIPCAEEEKAEVMTSINHYFCNEDPLCIDGVRVCFEKGWLLIRPSNTQPVLSIRFEAISAEDFTFLKNKILNALPKSVKNEFLRLCGENL